MELNRNSNAVFMLNYHLIFVVKYRKKIFTDDKIVEAVKEVMRKTAAESDVEIVNQECGEDHIHLMISTKPTTQLTKLVNYMKGRSARVIRQDFDLSEKLYGDSLWSDSYYIATCGNVSLDTLYRYIENQRKKD